jgi:hypothetical protein
MDVEKLCSCDVKIGNGLGQGLGSFTFIHSSVNILLKFIIVCVQVNGNTVITVINVLYRLWDLSFRFIYGTTSMV